MTDPAPIPSWRQAGTRNWYEGPLLGNGDLGVVVFGEDRLTFAVGKNDVWDRRLFTKLQKPQTFRDHINCNIPCITEQFDYPAAEWDTPPPPNHHRYMQPKPVCRVELTPAGRVEHSLSLADAELTTTSKGLRVVSRVQKDKNVIVLDIEADQPVTVRLSRHADTAGTGIQPPVHRVEGDTAFIVQDLPAETTYPQGFRFVVAARVEGGGNPQGSSTEITWTIAGKARLVLAVVTTRDAEHSRIGVSPVHFPARETGKMPVLLSAVRKLLAGHKGSWREHHRQLWRKFWERSWIRLSDPLLQDLWYMHTYLLACATRPGAVAPGLFSPWIVNDVTMWNNSYTNDYNFEQTFAAALSSNRPELLEAYLETIERNIPAAREWAREIFGAEGIAFGHELFPVDMRGQMRGGLVYVVETPFLAQHFWEYYEHTQDREFLRKRAYPVIAGVADFLASFATETKPGKFEFIPTRSCEHHIYDPDLTFHRNGTPELGFARYIFKAAMTGAELVKERDAGRMRRWRKVLQGLPEYPRFCTPAGDIFLDTVATDPNANFLPPISTDYLVNVPPKEYCAEMRPSKQARNSGGWMIYNCPTNMWHIWPAGQIDADSPPEELLTAIRTWQTARMEGLNDLIARHMLAARLGLFTLEEFKQQVKNRLLPNGSLTTWMNERFREMPEHVRRICEPFGVYTENFAYPLVLNEMMLQSHNGVIKLFPVLDPYLKAEFHRLRARGGFIISAAADYGYVRWAEIEATVSGECRVRLFGPSHLIRLEEKQSGKRVRFKVSGKDLIFRARKGATYRLTPILSDWPTSSAKS